MPADLDALLGLAETPSNLDLSPPADPQAAHALWQRISPHDDSPAAGVAAAKALRDRVQVALARLDRRVQPALAALHGAALDAAADLMATAGLPVCFVTLTAADGTPDHRPFACAPASALPAGHPLLDAVAEEWRFRVSGQPHFVPAPTMKGEHDYVAPDYVKLPDVVRLTTAARYPQRRAEQDPEIARDQAPA